MEYIEGGSLEERLQGRPMDWPGVITIVSATGEALHYAHQHNIIHRDIKPSNILMLQEDWPVLADFGLAKYFNEDSKLTKTGTLMGTPNYIAPEQIRNVDIDFRVDMYSLGVVMFEMVTGRVPFDYKIPNKIMLGHVMEPPPSPRQLNPGNCPPQLEAVILRMLRKNPDDRYVDMLAMIEALKEVVAANPQAEALMRATPTDTTRMPPPQSAPSKPLQRLFQPFQKILGERAGAKTTGAERSQLPSSDTPTKPSPTPDQGIDQSGARMVLQERNATINIPDKEKLVLGRTRGNVTVDIDLEPYQASKFGVSRRHALLTKRGKSWWLEDLHSLNGTFVNDVEIKEGHPVALKDGDIVRFSHMIFVFQAS
jgi:serine/threonine protein kinase